MRLTVIVASLGLGACASPGMQTALAPLTGQPVQLVFEQLGPPASVTPTGADTIYEWRSAKTVHGAVTRAANLAPPGAGGPTMAYAGPPVPYTCDLRILADGQGRIKDSQFGEQTGGCRESARKLSQLAYSG